MSEMSLSEMGFRDFLAAHRRNVDALETAYEAGIDGTGSLSELTELFDDAGFSLVLARSKATADLRDLEAASVGDMAPEDVDGLPQSLIDAITADVDAGLTDLATLDSDTPAGPGELAAADRSRVTRWVPSGDLLADPPFGEATADLEDKYGAWWTAGPQEDREDTTADDHDEWVEDWNRTVADLPDRDTIRRDHPFPISLTDADGEEF